MVIVIVVIVLVIVIIIFIVITRFGRPHDSLGPSVERVKHLANGFGYWGHASVPQALLKRQLYVDWFQTTKDNTICLSLLWIAIVENHSTLWALFLLWRLACRGIFNAQHNIRAMGHLPLIKIYFSSAARTDGHRR